MNHQLLKIGNQTFQSRLKSSGVRPCAKSPPMIPANMSPLPPFARIFAPKGLI